MSVVHPHRRTRHASSSLLSSGCLRRFLPSRNFAKHRMVYSAMLKPGRPRRKASPTRQGPLPRIICFEVKGILYTVVLYSNSDV